MKLISKHPGNGGYSPAVGLQIPPEGTPFEADDERGAQLVAAGLAAAVSEPRDPVDSEGPRPPGLKRDRGKPGEPASSREG